MEGLFFLVCSVFFGYAVQKLERMEIKINKIEDEIIVIKMSCHKRSSDRFSNETK